MLLMDPNDKSQLKALEGRYVDGVGVVNLPGGNARPDAACWAVLALQAAGGDDGVIEGARRMLAVAQAQDGRIPVTAQQPEAYWPTSLAVMAWHGAAQYQEPQAKAIQFLVDFQEIKAPDPSEIKEGHNVTIKGWPWVVRTHPWVEPTAYAALALRAAGQASDSRVQDAINLLLDRQLPSGGWNCGNTFTFGLEMRPTPETSGLSLQTLAGLVPKTAVEHSIAYMQSELAFLNSPISIAWAILGLHAWQEAVDRARERILQALARQEQLGPYNTVSLSLLVLAWHCEGGLVRFLDDSDSQDEK